MLNKTIKLLFVINDAGFFLSHRLPIAIEARNMGYEVVIATAEGNSVTELKQLGFRHITIPISRSGKSLFRELNALRAMINLFRTERPDIVHLVTIKPVLYGGIAARLVKVKGVVAAISGLGYVFLSKGIASFFTRVLVMGIYRFALEKNNVRVIFQNPDDRDLMIKFKIIRLEKTVMIRGSGVDLKKFSFMPEPDSEVVVTMAARLLRDKGVGEFIDAVRILKNRRVDAKFVLAGEPDPGNPNTIRPEELRQWQAENLVEVMGHKNTVDLFAQSHIIVLPSYREGLPKVLIEAAASGRAVVTSDVPGCRHAVEPGQTAILVPPRNAMILADAIEDLIKNPGKRQNMGLNGRKLAEEAFSIDKVVAKHIAIYEELLTI